MKTTKDAVYWEPNIPDTAAMACRGQGFISLYVGGQEEMVLATTDVKCQSRQHFEQA